MGLERLDPTSESSGIIRAMETAFAEVEPAPAGFWIRLVAVLVDWLVFYATELSLRVVAGLIWGAQITELPVFNGTLFAFMFAFGSVYYVTLHALFGQTVGKMVVRVQVVRTDGGGLAVGRSILRSIGYIVSGATLLVGYVIAGLRRDKRALHDLLAGTRVIYVRAPAEGTLAPTRS
jgi:uncharacterized RDD family membrane protein YckC